MGNQGMTHLILVLILVVTIQPIQELILAAMTLLSLVKEEKPLRKKQA